MEVGLSCLQESAPLGGPSWGWAHWEARGGGGGVALCGEEVELEQARPGWLSRRGSGMGEQVGSWRFVVFRKVRLWEAQVAQLGLSGAGISEAELS